MPKKTKKSKSAFSIPQKLPILPLMNMVVFPNVIMPLVVNDDSLIKLINDSVSDTKIVGIFANKPGDDGGYKDREIYSRNCSNDTADVPYR